MAVVEEGIKAEEPEKEAGEPEGENDVMAS